MQVSVFGAATASPVNSAWLLFCHFGSLVVACGSPRMSCRYMRLSQHSLLPYDLNDYYSVVLGALSLHAALLECLVLTWGSPSILFYRTIWVTIILSFWEPCPYMRLSYQSLSLRVALSTFLSLGFVRRDFGCAERFRLRFVVRSVGSSTWGPPSILRFLVLLCPSVAPAVPAAPLKTYFFLTWFTASESGLQFRTLLVSETLPAPGLSLIFLDFSLRPVAVTCYCGSICRDSHRCQSTQFSISAFWVTAHVWVWLVDWLPLPFSPWLVSCRQWTVFSLVFSCRCTLSPKGVTL